MLFYDNIVFDAILFAVIFENYLINASQCVNKSHKQCQYNYLSLVLFCDNTSFTRLPVPGDSEKINAQLDPKTAKVININSSCLDRLDQGDLKHYENVVFLNASSCQLTAIASQTFLKNKKLSRISLSMNRITLIDDDAFEGINNLTNLNLSSNRITAIRKGMFGYLTELRTLDLSNNQLEAIPSRCINSLVHLEVLHLSGNRLRSIGKFMLSGLRKLSYFNVAGNLINTIEETFFDVNPAIRTVDLSRNNITCLPQNLFKKNFQLIELFLNKNNLKVPSPQWFRKPLNADTKHAKNMLSNNPWTCDCSSEKYWDFLQNEVRDSELNFFFDVECYFPKPRRGKKLSLLRRSVFKECKHRDTQPLVCNNSLYVLYPPNLPTSSTTLKSLPTSTESFDDEKPEDAPTVEAKTEDGRVIQPPVPKQIEKPENGKDQKYNGVDFSNNIEVPWVIVFICGGLFIGGLFVCIGKQILKSWKRKPERKEKMENVESKMLNNNRDDEKSVTIKDDAVTFRSSPTAGAPVVCNFSQPTPLSERDSGHYSPSETDRQSYFYEDPNTDPKTLCQPSHFEREPSNRIRYYSETRSCHGHDAIHSVPDNMGMYRGRSASSIPHSQTFDSLVQRHPIDSYGNQSRNYPGNCPNDYIGNHFSNHIGKHTSFCVTGYPANYPVNQPIDPFGDHTFIPRENRLPYCDKYRGNQSCNCPANYCQRNNQPRYQPNPSYHPNVCPEVFHAN